MSRAACAPPTSSPSRIEAAQTAAKAYIKDQPRDVRIGIVAFAATALLVQTPDHRSRGADRGHRPLRTAARHGGGQRHPGVAEDDLPRSRVRPAVVRIRGAAQGDGAPLARQGAQGGQDDSRTSRWRPARTRRPRSSCSPTARRRPAPIRSRRRRWRPSTACASSPSASARVGGEIIGVEGWSMRVRLDEETLKSIAQITGAEYFYAGTAADLRKIYQSAEFAVRARAQGDRGHRAVRRCGRGAGAVVGALVACSGSIASCRSSVQSGGGPRDSSETT